MKKFYFKTWEDEFTKPVIFKNKRAFIFKGNLGCVFKSYQRGIPDVNDEVNLYSSTFRPFLYSKKSILSNIPIVSKYFGLYEICWTSSQLNSYEDIAKFYYDNMLKQIPNGTKIDCLQNCLKEGMKKEISES